MPDKKCPRCKKKKDVTNFSKDNSTKDGLRSYCKKCSNKYHKEYYEKNKEKINKYKNIYYQKRSKWFKDYKKNLICEICGENRWYVLIFHHKNPRDKKLEIGTLVAKNLSREKVIKEIKKCQVLCANCHRALHWRERNE